MDDKEWDVFMLEIEARNQALIQEFMVSKMRPRDIQALMQQAQQAQQPQQTQQQPEELNAITG